MTRDDSDHRVRFGALVAATARTMLFAWPLVLLAWAARAGVESIGPVLRAMDLWTVRGLTDPRQLAFSLATTVTIATVWGIATRWLLDGKEDAARANAGLAGYVTLIVGSQALQIGLSSIMMPAVHTTPPFQAGLGFILVGAVNLLLSLVYAALALWPISILVGEPLSPVQAARRMGHAYLLFILAAFLLDLPDIVLVQVQLFSRHFPRMLADRLGATALSSLEDTVLMVVLAQIYARRIRGADLAPPRSAAAGVI